jgi:two-component system, NtrC family, sensor histidine kinase HydH
MPIAARRPGRPLRHAFGMQPDDGSPAPAAVQVDGMSIRKTLLLGFLLVGLTPAVVLALLGFDRASRALQHEIELGLVAQADAVAADINRLLYERLQNATTWSRQEVMQDLKVGDVDKRLANFLQRLHRGYGGLYRRLQAVDLQGQIVATSDPARVSRAVPPRAGADLQRRVVLGDDPVDLTWRSGDRPELILRVPVASSFGPGQLGHLELVFDWAQVDRLLDQAGDAGRQLALVDSQGRLLAASSTLRRTWPRLAAAPAAWQGLEAGAHTLAHAEPWADAPMLAGVGRAGGFAGFEGFGFRLMVLLPRATALAPVRSMGGIFVAIVGALGLLTLFVSGAVSQTLARPILALTRYVRSRMSGARQTEPLPPPARGEIGELSQAFVQLLGDIDSSQRKLAQASALAAVGEMSAIIAHEVRTPLGIVRSSAQVLRRDPAIGEEGRELLGFIESETERLARLVTSMLDGARPRAPVHQPCDMNDLVRHAVALLSTQAARQDVSFTLQLDEADTALDCDPEQITQVLLNLMLNGLQILPQGGRIAVQTQGVSAASGEQLCVRVSDDGPGIAPEARARIFEAFFFQREGGLGLGLAVVQQIVMAHGGDIEAGDSELGGARFTIRLPRRQPEST